MRNITKIVISMAGLIILAGCAGGTVSQMTNQPGKEIRGKASDGGDIVYDGYCFYDYRDVEGRKGIALWIPPNVEYVRGILFHGNPGSGGDTRAATRDLALQEFAARFGFGIVGVVWFPGRQIRTDTGKLIINVFNDWAKMGKNPELANVPLICRGSSNAGGTAYGMACVVPERIICITPNVSASYGALPGDATFQVPAWIHIGPNDVQFNKNGVQNSFNLFAAANPKNAVWAWDAEQGKGHEIGHIDDVDMAYYETCIKLRLPADADPRKGPVKLTPLNRQDGWMADASTWENPKGITPISPIAEYKGDPLKAVWLPNKEMAILYQAIATYNNPITLKIEDLKEVENPLNKGTLLRSVGGNVLDPGTKLVLTCEPKKDFEFEKIEFYQCGNKVGEVAKGNPLKCVVTTDGSRAANAFVAHAVAKGGSVYTSYPAHVIVRDPKLNSILAAQRKVWLDNVIPAGPKPAAGSGSAQAKPAPSKPDDGVLVAYGLTAEQEEQFGKGAGVSAFWKDFGPDRDHGDMNFKSHFPKPPPPPPARPAGSQPNQTQPASQPSQPPPADKPDQAKILEQQAVDAASVNVKAAHSRAGLYLLFEINGGQAKPDEGTDFHIARMSSKELFEGNPVISRFSNFELTLALSEMQYQANMGSTAKPDTNVRLTYPMQYTMFYPISRSDAETKEKYGIVVRRIQLEGGKRAMEWFIPWAYVGKPGEMSEPAVGSRLGLILGYNGNKNLRWPRGIDPWGYPVAQGLKENSWGDLEIGPRF